MLAISNKFNFILGAQNRRTEFCSNLATEHIKTVMCINLIVLLFCFK
ncbi:hypothetical protein CSUNSWCD_615 [Campylobacter showae CSUNSWCD]|uniref:Uncharacterized protein n=1 Tax=Campylobacter showae CSUNSWCD TaxID=1244083 RepID=M5IPA1_9BACT|nr:hypothetical protein CSUNSWCD_615 [Campylobacter showae CSUNSWCD]